MRALWLASGIVVAAGLALPSGDASACGGYFVEGGSETVVAGHRMIVSISSQQTTLWDQIAFTGNPQSFAWVLPVKGIADVGLSSDVLFQQLESDTLITVASPRVFCDRGFGGAGQGGGGAVSGGIEDPVKVVAHKVVGPYETVQLSSQDPAALQTWLTAHGYEVPASASPMIDAYVGEGFDFLALKLVPGQGVDAMRPVRVSSVGASMALPLRMVAVGTGDFTPITLWIVSEGRYGPANFPSFTIDGSDLAWDWTTNSSNYLQVRAKRYAATNHKGWQVEAALPFSGIAFSGEMISLATSDPAGSGYADGMGQGAVDACQADLDDLLSTLDAPSVWVTRIRGEIAHDAFSSDLVLEAKEQSVVDPYIEVYNSAGDPCTDPAADGSAGPGSSGSGGVGTGSGSDAGGSGSGADPDAEGSCAIGEAPGSRWSLAVLMALGAASAWRRRLRSRSRSS